MNNLMHRFWSVGIVTVGVLVLSVTMFAAKDWAQGPQTEELTRALIGELRQLRIAIENLARASSRMQVISTRATQQEQRLSSLSNQLLTMKTKLADVSAETSFNESTLEQIQENLRSEPDPTARQVLERSRQAVKANLNSSRVKQATAQAEVEQLEQQTMTEQARLAEIQQRLDDVERLLGERRQ